MPYADRDPDTMLANSIDIPINFVRIVCDMAVDKRCANMPIFTLRNEHHSVSTSPRVQACMTPPREKGVIDLTYSDYFV